MDSNRYKTDHELNFINKLGTFSKHGKEISRQQLLKGYIRTSKLRTKWDGIDQIEAVWHCGELLKGMGKTK